MSKSVVMRAFLASTMLLALSFAACSSKDASSDLIEPPPPPPPPPGPPPPPPPAGTVFTSLWSTATGNTQNAVTDGGRWPVLACSSYPNVLSVVSGSSVGFTQTTNVLRVRMRGGSFCGMLQVNGVVPVSTTHYGRFYVRNDETGSRNGHAAAYNNVHGGSGADIQAVPWTREATASGANAWKMTLGGGAAYPFDRFDSPDLTNGVWYRFEWQMEYRTNNTVRMWPRIYDMAGTLLYDHDDYEQHDGGPTSLGEWYAASPNNVITLGSPSHARNWGMGNEGPGNAPDTGGDWFYAKFALSTTGWIGQ